MALTQLNGENFYETIRESDIPVLVDFYADWCQPCKRITPVLEEIAAEQEDLTLVCKVNVDENPDLASAYNIMSIPFVMSFKNGEPHKHVVGVVQKNELLALVE